MGQWLIDIGFDTFLGVAIIVLGFYFGIKMYLISLRDDDSTVLGKRARRPAGRNSRRYSSTVLHTDDATAAASAEEKRSTSTRWLRRPSANLDARTGLTVTNLTLVPSAYSLRCCSTPRTNHIRIAVFPLPPGPSMKAGSDFGSDDNFLRKASCLGCQTRNGSTWPALAASACTR